MAGEAEVLPAVADAGIEVGDVVGAGLCEIHPLAAEADAPSVRSSSCSAPASTGVTLSQRTSARVSSTTSVTEGASVSGMGGHYHRGAPKRRAPARVQADARVS